MELYFYEDCEYSQIVLNTISTLKIKDKFTFKDIRLNPDYAKELVELTGDVMVPCLLTQDGPMKEAKDTDDSLEFLRSFEKYATNTELGELVFQRLDRHNKSLNLQGNRFTETEFQSFFSFESLKYLKSIDFSVNMFIDYRVGTRTKYTRYNVQIPALVCIRIVNS